MSIVLPPVINSYGQYAVGEIAGFGGTGPASAVWPSANLSIMVPFFLPAPFTVTNLFCANGATATGNLDIGVYAADAATLLVSKGSTAQAGTSTLQILSVTSTVLPAGFYFMALSSSSASATFLFSSAPSAPVIRLAGVLQAATQVPLAASPTLAAATNVTKIPLFGISSVSTF